jgi:DNA end-binding protein Ku
MRAVWSGAIGFGLVHIPVKATVATRDKSVRFVQLHGEDGERIRYQRHCPEHGEIPYDEIVRGYPLGGDQYVVVEDEEFQALLPGQDKTIRVEDFVELEAVDPLFFGKSYYLLADGSGRAYRLLVEAMQETKRVAIGRFVLRAKQHLVAIRPWREGLVLELLHFADEVEEPPPVEAAAPTKKEQAMAVQLVESMSAPFDPGKYKDEFRERLLEMIEEKSAGRIYRPREKEAAPILALEEALEKSLAEVS